MTIILQTRSGEVTFESTFTDAEVADQLRKSESEFGRSLAEKFTRFGWSLNQRRWAHYLVWYAQQPTSPPAVTAGLKSIVELLDHAAKSLQYPRLSFEVGGRTVQLARAGANSRAPGSINVTDGRGYGRNTWYGRIDRDGATTIADSAILAFLSDFATDPARKAAEYGRSSGCCCFCATTLTDERSTRVGYGPVCAKKFGMPWGIPSDERLLA